MKTSPRRRQKVINLINKRRDDETRLPAEAYIDARYYIYVASSAVAAANL